MLPSDLAGISTSPPASWGTRCSPRRRCTCIKCTYALVPCDVRVVPGRSVEHCVVRVLDICAAIGARLAIPEPAPCYSRAKNMCSASLCGSPKGWLALPAAAAGPPGSGGEGSGGGGAGGGARDGGDLMRHASCAHARIRCARRSCDASGRHGAMQACLVVQTRRGRGVSNCQCTVLISLAPVRRATGRGRSPELDLEHLEVITSFCLACTAEADGYSRPMFAPASRLPQRCAELELEAMPKMCKAVSLLACVPLPN